MELDAEAYLYGDSCSWRLLCFEVTGIRILAPNLMPRGQEIT